MKAVTKVSSEIKPKYAYVYDWWLLRQAVSSSQAKETSTCDSSVWVKDDSLCIKQLGSLVVVVMGFITNFRGVDTNGVEGGGVIINGILSVNCEWCCCWKWELIATDSLGMIWLLRAETANVFFSGGDSVLDAGVTRSVIHGRLAEKI